MPACYSDSGRRGRCTEMGPRERKLRRPGKPMPFSGRASLSKARSLSSPDPKPSLALPIRDENNRSPPCSNSLYLYDGLAVRSFLHRREEHATRVSRRSFPYCPACSNQIRRCRRTTVILPDLKSSHSRGIIMPYSLR
jgi:hypothetical protein